MKEARTSQRWSVGARIGLISLLALKTSLATPTHCNASEGLKTGYATYYTVKSCQKEGTSGLRTANNEVFNEMADTCALPHHHFGGWYRVCNVHTAACVVVRHNDYGPGRHARQRGVVIDLTPSAFQQLTSLKQGRVEVSVEPINKP